MDKNWTITSLKGPDRVRKRPGVAFGSDGIEGVYFAIRIIIDIFITEAALGYSNKISVTINKDSSLSIYSYDRGFVLGDEIIDGKPVWYTDFCEMYAAPKFPNDDYYFSICSKHMDLYGQPGTENPKYQVDSDLGFDLCSTQYASEFMNVKGVHNGVCRKITFKKGFPSSELQEEKTNEESYTFIHFKMDDEVFTDTNIQFEAIDKILIDSAITIKGLKCELNDLRNGASVIRQYSDGITERCKELLGDSQCTEIFTAELEASGQDRYNKRKYDALIRIAVAFTNGEPRTECYHTWRELPYGGSHVEALYKKIEERINCRFWRDFQVPNLVDKIRPFDSQKVHLDDIKKHLVLITETNCTKYASAWTNGARNAIANKVIADMATDIVDDKFDWFLKQNSELILKTLKKYAK